MQHFTSFTHNCTASPLLQTLPSSRDPIPDSPMPDKLHTFQPTFIFAPEPHLTFAAQPPDLWYNLPPLEVTAHSISIDNHEAFHGAL